MRKPPMIGDSIALDLANTHFNVRKRLFDGIESEPALASWLKDAGPRVTGGADTPDGVVNKNLVIRFHELRDVIRAAGARAADGLPPLAVEVEALNAFARSIPSSPQLLPDDEGVWHLRAHADGATPEVALAMISADMLTLLGGPRAQQLRACPAPNCPLFFLQDRPRRHWCSPACGTRARAAASYARHAQARTRPLHNPPRSVTPTT